MGETMGGGMEGWIYYIKLTQMSQKTFIIFQVI